MYQQRVIVFELVANPVFHFVSTIVILCNCCLLLTDEYPRDAEWSGYVEMVDLGFVAVYTVEMLLKMFGLGFQNYFRISGWNTFDCFLVTTSIIAAVGGADTGLQSRGTQRWP